MIAFHVIQAVRNDDSLCRAGKIMIEGLDRAQRVEFTVSIEVPDQLFLFRVHTQDRVARIFILADQARNVLKLLVALRVLTQRLALLRFSFDIPMFLEQLRDHRHAHRGAAIAQAFGDLTQRQVRPADFFVHRVARSVIAQDGLEVLLQVFDGVETTFASSPFFRDLPSGNSGGMSSSARPRRIVFSAHPKSWAR